MLVPHTGRVAFSNRLLCRDCGRLGLEAGPDMPGRNHVLRAIPARSRTHPNPGLGPCGRHTKTDPVFWRGLVRSAPVVGRPLATGFSNSCAAMPNCRPRPAVPETGYGSSPGRHATSGVETHPGSQLGSAGNYDVATLGQRLWGWQIIYD